MMLLMLISLIIGFFFSAAILFLVAKQLKLKDKTFVTAMKTIGVVGVAGILVNLLSMALPEAWSMTMGVLSFLLINVSLSIYMIKTNYKLEIKNALVVWAIWLVLSMILAMLIGITVAVVLSVFVK